MAGGEEERDFFEFCDRKFWRQASDPANSAGSPPVTQDSQGPYGTGPKKIPLTTAFGPPVQATWIVTWPDMFQTTYSPLTKLETERVSSTALVAASALNGSAIKKRPESTADTRSNRFHNIAT